MDLYPAVLPCLKATRSVLVGLGALTLAACGSMGSPRDAGPDASSADTATDVSALDASQPDGAAADVASDAPADVAPPPPVCPAVDAGAAPADGVRAIHHDGQTFVTWRDVAEGMAGAQYRYSLYRATEPITAANVARARLVARGILNNSGRRFDRSFNPMSRIDPAAPGALIESGGAPLPQGTGLAVYTARASECAYYAVVATDLDGMPVGPLVTGRYTTVSPVAESQAPIAPIKYRDGADVPNPGYTVVTGTPSLPLTLSLHASSAGGGESGAYGDAYLYWGTEAMGYVDGMPGLFSVEERNAADRDGQHLVLRSRDTIVAPSGNTGFETWWFGYATVPQWSISSPVRAYPFTERRLEMIIPWAIERYRADPERVYCTGGSMGAWGSMSFGFRHPEIFAAVYPDRPRMRQARVPSIGPDPGADVLMDDGVTAYRARMDSVAFAQAHAGDLPFLAWGIGRRDGFATWAEQVDMVRALRASRHGFAFAWTNGDHGDSSGAQRVAAMYPRALFARHQSYPAFSNSSADDDLGDGDPANGALTGGINLGFQWRDVADEPARWAVTLSNTLDAATITVDVTPRRRQRFRPAPGSTVAWSTSTGLRGNVTVDSNGLVTVERVEIARGASVTLTLTGP